MSAPICAFVRAYAQSHAARLHMPGHKGRAVLGFEPLDITEIDGADELYAPSGIIAESEAQAGALFGAHTLYSAGGSTLCIQTMLHLLALHAREKGERPLILAGRNAHRAFVNAAALLDLPVRWLYPASGSSYHSCSVTPEALAGALRRERPSAVYLTSPDYLGNVLDIRGLARVCRAAEVPLAVDNAHGAYLRFLPAPAHPIGLGATLCCDSAHKTLPVVTGGAYLHIAPDAPEVFHARAKASMSLFGSSSPSYLILQSLDAANDRMEAFRAALAGFLPLADALKARVAAHGWDFLPGEPLKLTLRPKSFGYTGPELACTLESARLFPEFYDPDFVVLMLSPYNGPAELVRLGDALTALPRRSAVTSAPPPPPRPAAVHTPREALFAASELVSPDAALGRVSASAVLSCPPAVPLAVCGERIDECVVANLKYYAHTRCAVLR